MKRLMLFMLIISAVACSAPKGDIAQLDEYPAIYPDYINVTIPSSIAPLNFGMGGEFREKMDVIIKGADGFSIHAAGNGQVNFPVGRWKKMLKGNEGDSLSVVVSAKFEDGWKQYKEFSIYVSPDYIDYGLVYRLIAPGYESFGNIGIFERELSSFRENQLVSIDNVDGCVNCHTFRQCDPSDFGFHIRGKHTGTFIRHNGAMSVYNTKTHDAISNCAYPYWHPSGNYIAYSTNMTRQGFFQGPSKVLEVFDLASDIQIYDVRNNRLYTAPQISSQSMWETFPSFSPDGKTLYFCVSGPRMIPQMLGSVEYNLCSVSFNPETGEIGDDVRILVNSEQEGTSVSFPRPSPDGKYLMFTKINYGTFSIWHSEADLWLLNLETGESRRLNEVNSIDTESYHSWSSNGRWFVFSSRRDDGLYTRSYLCHFDENGICAKPFLLPQKNPKTYYRNEMRSFNIPEFVTGPVNLNTRQAAKLIRAEDRIQFEAGSNQ